MSATTRRRPAPEVVLMCGVAGSGKITYALRLEAEGYVRLSIDEEVWARSGRYGIDYDPARYEEFSAGAEATLRARLVDLLAQGRDVVVDFSSWRRSDRELYEKIVEENGGRWRLVHLPISPDVLRERLLARSARFDANAAFPVDEAMLAHFLDGFEVPDGDEAREGPREQD